MPDVQHESVADSDSNLEESFHSNDEHEQDTVEQEQDTTTRNEMSNDECLALLMTFISKHKLSNAAIDDLLKLLNTLKPGCVPRTKYFIEKLFMMDQDIELHFYCHDCKTYLGTDPTNGSICQTCNSVFCKTTYLDRECYFLTASVGEQLRTLFEQHDLAEHIEKEQSNENSNMRNICTGRMYKRNEQFLSDPDNISLTFNTDGVPVFSSSNFSVWPLYLQINEVKATARSNFTILQGLWFGNEKPSFHTFLVPFIKEMTSLHSYGVHWHDKDGTEHVSKCICILGIVDSVARAPLQGIKQFNGEHGCTFCLHEGVRVNKGNGFVNTYPLAKTLPQRRTHDQIFQDAEESLRSREPVHGVKEVSPLFLLPCFDMVDSWSPDYMHSVLLGVVRQVTNLIYDSGSHGKEFYLGTKLETCNSILLGMNPPQEISRSPQSLKERAHWKANEWRAFLLFYSLFIFQSMLPSKYWNHWLLLSNAVYILLGIDISTDFINKAELCLYKFVCDFKDLYGAENISFNVHLLTHLADSVRNWGPLWGTSAFYFENENGKLLNSFHGTQHVQKQMVKKFFGLKVVDYFVNKCVRDAPQFVIDSLITIGGDFVKISPLPGDGVCGAPSKRSLSLVEKEVLHELCSKEITAEYVYSYKRANMNGRFITTKQYSLNYKRNNSVICIGGIYCQVYDIIRGKISCSCDGLCNCVEEIYFLCHELVLCPTSASVDSYTGLSLRSLLSKVALGGVKAFYSRAFQSKLFSCKI